MTRRSTVALAALAAVLAGVFAVVTNLATDDVPKSLRWVHNGILLWSVVASLIVIAAIIAALQARSSYFRRGSTNSRQPEMVDEISPPISSATSLSAISKKKRISNLPTRNPLFTGRDKILEDIRLGLESGPTSIMVLHGLGGIGKSQIALEYAYRNYQAGYYRLVWWIRADSASTVAEDFVRLAAALGVRSGQDFDGDPTMAAMDVLSSSTFWLLVFDNVDTPKDAALSLLGGNGHILITTRNRGWGSRGDQMNVQEFQRSESVALLQKRVGEKESRATAELASLLGDLPLAVAQAGAFIEINSTTVEAYLRLYRDPRNARRLRAIGLDSTEYPASVALTWLLNFKQLKHQRPAAVDLLRLCAFLNPDRIALSLFDVNTRGIGTRLRRALSDPFERTETIGALARANLITVTQDEAIRIHRLVQAVTRDQLNFFEATTWVRRAFRLVEANYRRLGSLTIDSDLAPHLTSVLMYARKYPTLARRRRILAGELSSFERSFTWAPSRLLDPRFRVVPFMGRQDQLADLIAWCESGDAGQLRLLTGPRGVGKTRLAMELATYMTEAGWRCARVVQGQEGEAIGSLRAIKSRRALLVVDYAETRARLLEMLATLASPEGHGVKVLLLARLAGDWWAQLPAAAHGLIHIESSAELRLSPKLDSGLSNADVFFTALKAFADTLALPVPEIAMPANISTGSWRMLDLHYAALLALMDSEHYTTGTSTHTDTLSELLLSHEKRYWYLTAQASGLAYGPTGMSHLTIDQVIAASCLLGAATEADVYGILSRVPGISPSYGIARWLRELYPPSEGSSDWLGVFPDELAITHTLKELLAYPEFAHAILDYLDARQAQHAISFLNHASIEHPEALRLLTGVKEQYANLSANTDTSPNDQPSG
jgi:hypothetical protein